MNHNRNQRKDNNCIVTITSKTASTRSQHEYRIELKIV